MFHTYDRRKTFATLLVFISVWIIGAPGLNLPDLHASASSRGTSSPEDEVFLESVAKQTFKYFLHEYHPTTGLINDHAPNKEGGMREMRTSIAATGFGITAYVIAAERGWIGKKEAYERILTAARFFDERAESVHGFFYHFLEGYDGKNVYDSELSSIDSALLAAGLLTAAEYFPETELARRARKIYEKMDFDWMRNGADFISMGWHAKSEFIPSYWSNFDEGLLLYILAIGSPAHPVPPASWQNVRKNVVEREEETFVFAGPLFIHQYPHVWLDLKNKNDGVADYFENSVRATRANKRFSEAHRDRFKTYAAGYWGLSASDGPFGYKAYGAADPQSHDGTVSPLAAGASIVFTPELSMAQMRKVRHEKRKLMWGRYGFGDAMNLDREWFSEMVIGIDAGALLAAIENYRSGFIWKLFMQNKSVKRGLARAGFVEGTKSPSLAAGQPVYEAHYNATGIVVDGLLDDWTADENRIRLRKEHLDYGTVSKLGDAGADIALAWNETYLYISADVEDEEIVAKRTVRYSHKDDLLELFIDLDGDGFTWKSSKDPQYGFSFDPKHKTPRLFDWGTEKEIPLGKDALVAMEITEKGYVIEAALPWMALDIVPSNPLELAITPALHDLDTGNEAKLTWYFKDRGSGKGIALGKVRLKKS